MLQMAVVFLVIGLVAALLGFTTVAGASIAIAKMLAGLFLLLFLVFLILGVGATADLQDFAMGTGAQGTQYLKCANLGTAHESNCPVGMIVA